MWCAYRSVWITVCMYKCVRWVCKGFASDRSPYCGLQVGSCSLRAPSGSYVSQILHLRAQGGFSGPLTTIWHLLLRVQASGGGLLVCRSQRTLACLSSQAPALQYRTSAGSPANQSPTSPVSNQGFSPGSSPQVRPPPLPCASSPLPCARCSPSLSPTSCHLPRAVRPPGRPPAPRGQDTGQKFVTPLITMAQRSSGCQNSSSV